MKIREISIGNYVRSVDSELQVGQIASIDSYYNEVVTVVCNMFGKEIAFSNTGIEDIEGVPITKEILERNGFVDVNKNVYTISIDTKVVSKIIEILLIPKLDVFAKRNSLELELPSMQNYYPDLTFKDGEGHYFAVDFKTSYYEGNTANGLTLGSYWGYFRNRDKAMNMDRPYNNYQCHLVLGILYKQREVVADERTTYSIDEVNSIKSVINDFIFFVQPKWKIALDRPGSGNTRNIGGITNIQKLIYGQGTFANLGEKVFDDYWMNYFNVADAKLLLQHPPYYNNINTYKEFLKTQATLFDNINDK